MSFFFCNFAAEFGMTMKKTLLLFALCSLFLRLSAQERIMVIADPHVYPLALIESDPSFDTYLAKQRKMVDLSEPAWNALMDTAMKYRPELLFIPGDLTRDGEPESHALVAASLKRLNDAGIQTLVIPGNHDLPDRVEWDSLYMSAYPDRAQDPGSYSYAVEPLPGVTVLGIDGSHGKAATGSLSDATRDWILRQADSAQQKGNIVIAMSHWQLIEHFDMQAFMESSCQFKNADALRDSLMLHGVRLVLTGHFHISGVSTYLDTLLTHTDSLVEITTGSPITFPCPYRWLTLSEDRNHIDVATSTITSLPGYPDLYGYSRESMREHIAQLVPSAALRGWYEVEQSMEYLRENTILSGEIISLLVERAFPKTDSAKIDIVERHLGHTGVELYLLHSEANEYLHPEADSLAQAFYDGLRMMIHEMSDTVFRPNGARQTLVINLAINVAKNPVQSIVEDITNWNSRYFSNRTDDLAPTLYIRGPKPQQDIPFTAADPAANPAKILRDGQLYIRRDKHLYTLTGQEIQ